VADAAGLLEQAAAELLLWRQMDRMMIGGEQYLRRTGEQEQNHRGDKLH